MAATNFSHKLYRFQFSLRFVAKLVYAWRWFGDGAHEKAVYFEITHRRYFSPA